MIRTKMRVLLCVFLFVFAPTGEAEDFDEYEALARYRNKPEFHQNFQEPVPFGHILRDGFGDPFSEIRQPVDGYKLGMREPRNKEEALKLLKTAKGSRIVFNDPNIAKLYSNPNEEMPIARYVNPLPEVNETMLKWYDLATMQARNAMRPNSQQYVAKKKKASVRHPVGPPSGLGQKSGFFPKNSFNLDKIEERPLNWTTCDQFAVGAIFAPKDVVNVKWTPFYIWDTQGMNYAIEHTFEYPSSKLVNLYHFKYSKMVNKAIDWTKAKLLMKGITETLLIAADKRGLFHAIVKHDLPDSATNYDLKLPSLTLRIKIEDPYLVMTFCEEYYATIMAVSGNEPIVIAEMEAEAATVKFIGTGRPVWRDIEGEKDKIKAEKEEKIRQDSESLIVVNEPLPSIGED